MKVNNTQQKILELLHKENMGLFELEQNIEKSKSEIEEAVRQLSKQKLIGETASSGVVIVVNLN